MLNETMKDLIFGTLLGDSNLQTGNKGRTWRYRAVHKEEHKEYLFHKYDILQSLCTTEPRKNKVYDPRTKKENKRYYFNTVTNASLNFYSNMFYTYDREKDLWVKDVPSLVEKFLTPRALAYFYMDDGALKWVNHSNAMRICTESFSEQGVNRIKTALKNLYNVDTTLTKKYLLDGSIGYRISIPEKSSSTFVEVIKPYLVDCMKYKVSNGQRGHL